MEIVGATLVVALQGGHKTRPYRKSPLTPLYKRGDNGACAPDGRELLRAALQSPLPLGEGRVRGISW